MTSPENANGPEVLQVIDRLALSERSAMALNRVIVRDGDTQTDVLNRAIQVYEYVTSNEIYVRQAGWRNLWSKFLKLTIR